MADLGSVLTQPRTVLMISAHWFFGATTVTAMVKPRTIHDFCGSPQALFDFDYPAPGAPEFVPGGKEKALLLPILEP